MTVSHISLTRAVKKILCFSPLENNRLALNLQTVLFRGMTKSLEIYNERLKANKPTKRLPFVKIFDLAILVQMHF